MLRAWIAHLEAEQQRRATDGSRDRIERYLARLKLGLTPAAHHRLLIHELERVEAGECDRLMVMMPPGSAKSTYASQIFPAWYLGRHPTRSILAASHTQELADRFGRRVRNIFQSPEHYAVFGVGVAQDRQAASQWETDAGGEYFAAGVGGAIAGHRADLGLIDDPVKSREDADSEIRRNRVWEWYVNDFVPRLKPNAPRILIMTRWHESDLGGRLLEHEGELWRRLVFPMLAQSDDPIGRQPGERLWPEWFTEEMVTEARRDTRTWNALYQQEPAAAEGDYFHLDWFGQFANLPSDLATYGASDYAVSEGKGDYTEHGIFAVDPLGNLYIIDWWRGQTGPEQWVETQCNLIKRHRPVCWFGEAGVIQKAVQPYLLRRMNERQTYCRIEWLPSVVDKATRCRSFQAMASMGKVMILWHAPWRAELLGQLTRFPAGKYDDGVDVCSLIGRGLEMMPASLPTARRGRSQYRSDYNPYAIRDEEIMRG